MAGRFARLGRSVCEPLALLIATLVVYYPAWHGGVLWDDNAHLTRPELQSTAGLWRIWFDIGATQQYYPSPTPPSGSCTGCGETPRRDIT